MFNRTLLIVGVSAFAIAGGSSHALAQDQNAGTEITQNPHASEDANQEENSIVVTGIRATQRSAIEAKRASEGVSEVLNAEDIGQLPERNIADAVQRLAGVNGNNDKGRSNQISLRGLGGVYTLTQVNNRQVASSFGNRSVNLDLYPSEVVGKAVINKTPSADQTEGGIGGSVDISTFRPLSVGNYAAVNAQAIYSPSSKHLIGENGLGYRGSVVISRKFADDTLGILVGASRLRETITAERFTAGAWSNADFDNDGVGGDFGFGVRDRVTGELLAAPGYIKQEPSVDENRRDSVFASIEWKPSDRFSIAIDGLYSNFKTDGVSPFLNFNFFCDASITGTAAPGIGAGSFTSDSVCIEAYSGAQRSRDKTYNFGLNADYNDGNGFSISGDVSYSRAPRTYTFPFVAVSGNYFSTDVSVDFTGGDTIPNISAGGVNLSDPAGQNISSVFVAANEVALEKLFAAKLDMELEFDAGFLTSVETGIRYAKRSKASNINNDFLLPPAGGVSVASLASPFPFRNLYGDYASNLPRSWLYFDAFAALDALDNGAPNLQDPGDLAASFDLSEASYAFYAKANFGGEVAAIPFRGNFGLRVVRTEVASSGAQIAFSIDPNTGEVIGNPGAPLVPVEVKNAYRNILPSFTATFDLADNLLFRTAAAIAIIRPDFLDLRASTNINVGPVNPANPRVGSRGNPFLKPVLSRQADVSLEWYPREGTFLAVAGFYKDLDSFYGEGSTILNPGAPQEVTIAQPTQSKEAGGKIKGVEISGSFEMDMLPGPLKYLTAYGNLTLIDIAPQRDYNVATGIESFSLPLYMVEKTYNIGIFYDDGAFTAGLNYYGQGASPQRDGNDYFLRRPFQLLSASIGYTLTDKIQLTFSGNNLLEERQDYGELGVQQNAPNVRQLYRSTPQGRSFFGGVRVQF